MPLKYNNGSCLTLGESIDNLESLIYSEFEGSSKVLHSLPVVRCPPKKGLLYVGQREYAVTTADDEVIDTLGSDDATTCHIVVLRHSGSRVTGLCHFDGCNSNQGVRDLVDRVQTLSEGTTQGRLELHIVGGFKDDNGSSEELSRELLSEFHKVLRDVYLLTACVSELNNTVKDGVNFPIIYGIAVSVMTGDIIPASYDYKGPDEPVRCLRHFIGDKDVKNIYNHTNHTLSIGPFSYSKFGQASLWLQQNDETIRKYMSTSPAAEPQHFAQTVREAISFYLMNPKSETVFPNNQHHVFTMTPDGYWVTAS